MITLNKILDSARKSCSRDSDAAVAEALKVSRQTVMQWRSGARRITDEHLMAAIELGRLDPALAVLVRQEMAETKAEKKAWSTLWDRLSAAAAVLVLVVVAMPGVARAKSFEIKGMEAGNAAVCILCSKPLRGRSRTARLNHRPCYAKPRSQPPQPAPRGLAATASSIVRNDLFLFKGGSIQSLIGNESQRSQWQQGKQSCRRPKQDLHRSPASNCIGRSRAMTGTCFRPA